MGDAVKHALDKGVVVVAAMGNDGDNSKSYPAAYPGVVAVGAVDKTSTVADFSQYVVGDRQQIAVASSEHYKFANGQMTWRVDQHVDG